jgi:hypothetical protein
MYAAWCMLHNVCCMLHGVCFGRPWSRWLLTSCHSDTMHSSAGGFGQAKPESHAACMTHVALWPDIAPHAMLHGSGRLCATERARVGTHEAYCGRGSASDGRMLYAASRRMPQCCCQRCLGALTVRFGIGATLAHGSGTVDRAPNLPVVAAQESSPLHPTPPTRSDPTRPNAYIGSAMTAAGFCNRHAHHPAPAPAARVGSDRPRAQSLQGTARYCGALHDSAQPPQRPPATLGCAVPGSRIGQLLAAVLVLAIEISVLIIGTTVLIVEISVLIIGTRALIIRTRVLIIEIRVLMRLGGALVLACDRARPCPGGARARTRAPLHSHTHLGPVQTQGT